MGHGGLVGGGTVSFTQRITNLESPRVERFAVLDACLLSCPILSWMGDDRSIDRHYVLYSMFVCLSYLGL